MILPYLSVAVLVVATLYAAVVSFRQPSEPAAGSWIFPAAAGRRIRIFVGVATLILVIGIGSWFALSVQHTVRRSSRFLIPDGYAGWVRVEFEVQGAPALPVEGGQYVLRIGPDGSLTTSSLEQFGWAKDSYYFDSVDGLHLIPDAGPQSLIWGKINGEAAGVSGKRKYEEFFVGTQQQFKDQGKVERRTIP